MNWVKKIIYSLPSFRKQLFVIFTLSVLGMSFITSIATSWFASKQMREQIINEGFQVTANFASQSMLALLYASADNAEEAATSALLFPSVNYVKNS